MRVYRQLAVFGCLVFLPTVAYAQASIAGFVKDTSGAILPGVLVEASSPALIEKVRSVTSDGTGQYKIVDLRPGVYSVTFTLTGFQTVKREGIELAGSFAATVNADLALGSVTETLIVTGEAPTGGRAEHEAQRGDLRRRHFGAAGGPKPIQPGRAPARRDADQLHRQQHSGRRRHAQHGHHHLLGPRQPGRRSAPDDQRTDRAQSAGVGVGEQFRARHGHRGRGDARLLVRLGRGGGRRPGHQPDSEGRRQCLPRLDVRRRRQRIVPGQQLLR